MGLGVLRVEADHLAPVGGGLGVLSPRPVGGRAVEIGVGVPGIEAKDGAVVGKGKVVIAPGLEDILETRRERYLLGVIFAM